KEQPRTYPLSYGQRALWFVHQTAPESAAYNIARVIRIVAGLDVGALRLAFQALVDRHPCLRTTVLETAGEPVQQVAEKVEVCFEYFDAGDWSQVELEKALVQQSQRPFSLTLGPLFRTALYARSEKEYLLHIAVHHLVADYWSLTLLLDEVGKLYQAFANKAGTQLVPLEYSYADFVEWQREKLSGPGGERLRDYWKSELAGELPPLSLPADHVRPPVQTFRGASLPFSLDARLTKALKRLGEEHQATLFTTLLAAFQVLLYRLTSQKQVIVGCPIAGRSRAEFANIAGYFVNAVPLRADFEQRQTFTEFLSQVRNRVAKAFAHELYPFSLMVEQLGIVRDPAVPPIFQSAFVFQQTYGGRSEDFVRFALGQPQAQVTLGGLQLEHVAVEQPTAQFDLTLTVGEGPDGMVGAWEYSSDLFEQATIARWAECFSILLEGIISHPDISVSQLPILSGSQYGRLVEELNRTKLEYDSGQCLHELIEEQAKTKPASTAIVYRETELSYTELNERANQVARYLLRSGVEQEDLVGVCMRRSPEMVVAMLGIWKANAAYVPLDPQYPEERLRFMLEDADAKAVITEESLKERVGGTSATVLSWDGVREQIDKESKEKVGRPACSLQLAYLIYTSGSSGVPKGVMLTHRNAVAFVAWARQTFTEEEFSGVLAATSICFDLSIYELWATLSCGGTVVLADDVISWWESLQGGRVTNRARLLNTVPSAVAQLIEQGPLPEGVVTINLAGEALKEELVSELWQRGNLKRVNNLYGPTETTTYSSWTPVEAEKKLTIGRGVGNTQLYVLDQELELAPLGVVGELYIAGAGVGRG
ncbi:MAG TPA: condensation domain-containing protein, partial [Candidatus Limnocylindrales bacterium]|nr:condensation domain-containing protein [Candidatus Limnocylindrales bacterium]